MTFEEWKKDYTIKRNDIIASYSSLKQHVDSLDCCDISESEMPEAMDFMIASALTLNREIEKLTG